MKPKQVALRMVTLPDQELCLQQRDEETGLARRGENSGNFYNCFTASTGVTDANSTSERE